MNGVTSVQDVALALDVSIAVAAPAAYVDISPTVDATDVRSAARARTAPRAARCTLARASWPPSGASSVSGGAQGAVAASALQQFIHTVHSAGITDEFATGLLQLAPGQATTIVQAFTPPPPMRRPSSRCPRPASPPEPMAARPPTQAVLADLFTNWPGLATATGEVANQTLTLLL